VTLLTDAEVNYKEQETDAEREARLMAALASLPASQREDVEANAALFIARIKERHPLARISFVGALEVLAALGVWHISHERKVEVKE